MPVHDEPAKIGVILLKYEYCINVIVIFQCVQTATIDFGAVEIVKQDVETLHFFRIKL